MNFTKLALSLLMLSNLSSADDTPFLVFDCACDRAIAKQQFRLRFKNDNSVETDTWSSTLGQTKIHFEKVNKRTVKVSISTGIPGISHAAPHQFRFAAPTTNDEFNFSFSLNPLHVSNELFSLTCLKVRNE